MNSVLLLGLHSRHPITQTSSSPGPEWSTGLPPGHCLLPGCDLILCLFSPEHPPGHSTAVPAFPQGSGLAFLGEFSQLCKILPVNQSHSGHGMAFALLNSSWKWPTAWTSSDQAAGSGWISGAGAASSPRPWLSPPSPERSVLCGCSDRPCISAPVALGQHVAKHRPCGAVLHTTPRFCPSSGCSFPVLFPHFLSAAWNIPMVLTYPKPYQANNI